MAEFTIPKGEEFRFNVKVIEKDSFLPMDVAQLDSTNSYVKFQDAATLVCLSNTGVTVTKVPDDVAANPLTYFNGMIAVYVPAAITTLMRYERGDKVDDYYLKPTYQATIHLRFLDTTPSRTVVLNKVYVAPVVC